MVIHFLYCISINIFKFVVDYLHAIHIFILHYMVIHFLYCISINILKFLADYLHAIHITYIIYFHCIQCYLHYICIFVLHAGSVAYVTGLFLAPKSER